MVLARIIRRRIAIVAPLIVLLCLSFCTTKTVLAFTVIVCPATRTVTKGSRSNNPLQTLQASSSSSSSDNDKQGSFFPMSTRAILRDEAKQFQMGYAPSGWSNRVGSVLTPVAVPGVYTADRPFYWNKIDVGCRMTVIKLSNNNNNNNNNFLFIHSPVALDKPLQDALEQLGTVKYIISPNYEHLKFANQWHQAYPEAQMWGCPGLSDRMPQISFTGEFGTTQSNNNKNNNNKQQQWPIESEIQPIVLNDFETNPFTGTPFFNEVIFYHVPSKSLLTTDLFWNYPQPDGIPNSNLSNNNNNINDNGPWELAPSVDNIPLGSQLWKIGMDKIYLPFYKNFMIQNQQKYQQITNLLTQELEIETLIPAHGDILRGVSLNRLILSKHLAK